MGRLLARALVAGLVLLATGCATTRDPRRDLLEGTSGHVLYHLPPEDLLAQARALLVERQYELLPTADPLYVHTTWKIAGNLDMGASWSRYLVQAHRLADGSVFVRAYKMTYTTNGRAASHPGWFAGQKEGKGRGSEGHSGRFVAGEPLSPTKPNLERAHELEWALLKRMQPAFAARLERQVDAYLAGKGGAPGAAADFGASGISEVTELPEASETPGS